MRVILTLFSPQRHLNWLWMIKYCQLDLYKTREEQCAIQWLPDVNSVWKKTDHIHKLIECRGAVTKPGTKNCPRAFKRKEVVEEESNEKKKGIRRKEDHEEEHANRSVALGLKQRQERFERLLRGEIRVTETICNRSQTSYSPASSDEPFYPPAPVIVSQVPSHHMRVVSPARFDILHSKLLDPFFSQQKQDKIIISKCFTSKVISWEVQKVIQ